MYLLTETAGRDVVGIESEALLADAGRFVAVHLTRRMVAAVDAFARSCEEEIG